MKKIRDYKSSGRAWWMVENPDALLVTKGEFLKSSWNKTAHEVNEEGRAVVLLKNKDMVGTVIPAAFLYEFHRKMPHLKDMDPIIHVPEKDFKDNFDQYSEKLKKGASLVILDKDNHPKFAIASREFSVDVVTNEQGFADFRDRMADYMFNDVVFDLKGVKEEPDKDAEYIAEAYEEMKKDRPIMSDKDADMVERVLAEIEKIDPDRESIHETVQNITLD